MACDSGWTPSQVRHAAATRLRELAGGLDAVQAQLGHRHADTTEIYAQNALDKA
ncbi:hypothetical protein LCGC14_3121410, partial [marine sediment metagenome]